MTYRPQAGHTLQVGTVALLVVGVFSQQLNSQSCPLSAGTTPAVSHPDDAVSMIQIVMQTTKTTTLLEEDHHEHRLGSDADRHQGDKEEDEYEPHPLFDSDQHEGGLPSAASSSLGPARLSFSRMLSTGIPKVYRKAGFGPELEFHNAKMGGGLPAGLQSNHDLKYTLAETATKKGFDYPDLRLMTDHFGKPAEVCIEAVFGPVSGDDQGVSFLLKSWDVIDQTLGTLLDASAEPPQPTPIPLLTFAANVAKEINKPMGKSADDSQMPNVEGVTVEKTTKYGIYPTYMQLNLQVAMKNVPMLWTFSARLDSRVMGFAAVHAAREIVSGKNSLQSEEFVGFLSQFLLYTLAQGCKAQIAPAQASNKNTVGVLVKASLQDQLVATILSETPPSKSNPRMPPGPVDVEDLERFVETEEPQTDGWVELFSHKISDLIEKRDEDLVFNQAKAVEKVLKLIGATDVSPELAESLWLWKGEGQTGKLKMAMGAENVQSCVDDFKIQMRTTFTDVFKGIGSRYTGADSLAGTPVAPFFNSETGQYCVLAETRADDLQKRDLPKALLPDLEMYRQKVTPPGKLVYNSKKAIFNSLVAYLSGGGGISVERPASRSGKAASQMPTAVSSSVASAAGPGGSLEK